MHSANDLWIECRESKLTVTDAQRVALAVLSQRFSPGTQYMCGNGVHYDRRMLEETMPQLHDFFHYRNFDISSLIQGQEYGTKVSGRPEQFVPPKPTSHRGMSDVDWNIAAYRAWLGNHEYYQAMTMDPSEKVSPKYDKHLV